MPISSRYLLIASMDVAPEAEDLFNEIYDNEHIKYLLEVPGVRSVTRVKGVPASFGIGGRLVDLPVPSPIHTAIYEIDDPSVLSSPEWAVACEKGRWAADVRPHTSNRSHAVFKVR